MKVLFVTSESNPFIKTGGLGDVMGALPQALNKLGVDARVVFGISNPDFIKDKVCG